MDDTITHHRIAIIGSGFGGLGMAIRLKEAGVDDFVVLERDADIGGTWWANSYPGCQCDIPSHLYSFSFAPNPDWTRTYPEQPELERYLKGCAERFGVRDHIHCGCEVRSAEWDENSSLWHLQSTQGALTAQVLIASPGGLSEPSIPDLPGLEQFAGTVFHTARWNHKHDLHGRRVGVVGTGASAIQAVPRIQPAVEHLTVFQRTPPWVVPHSDRPTSDRERARYRHFPLLQRLARAYVYWSHELLVLGLVYRPALMKMAERRARAHITKQVTDPELRAQLTPDYRLGCKRILPSNSWYPALQEPNVMLVTHDVREIRPDGVLAGDGSVHKLDTIIFATGFHATDGPLAQRVRGVAGKLMADVWAGSPQAYLGTAVAGFPNLFFLSGPNTGLGHNSVVFMLEAQIHYVMDALNTMSRRGVTRVEVRRAVQDAFNEQLQGRMPATVWSSGGCSSWYIDANGRNTTIWPDFTWRFRRRTRHFQPSDYLLGPVSSPDAHQPTEPEPLYGLKPALLRHRWRLMLGGTDPGVLASTSTAARTDRLDR